jgi:hypothetical protein
MELAALFQGHAAEPRPADAAPTLLPLKWPPAQPGATFSPVELQPLVESAQAREAWSDLGTQFGIFWPKVAMAEDQWQRTGSKFQLWPATSGTEIAIGGIPFRIPVVDGYVRPVLLAADGSVRIPLGRAGGRLHILGQVTFPSGYPVRGQHGETIATYRLAGGGHEQRIPVRNGIEAAQANLIYQATRIQPIATAAQPALKYVKDIVREQYQVLLWTVPVEKGRVDALTCEVGKNQPAIAIFGLTVEA